MSVNHSNKRSQLAGSTRKQTSSAINDVAIFGFSFFFLVSHVIYFSFSYILALASFLIGDTLDL